MEEIDKLTKIKLFIQKGTIDKAVGWLIHDEDNQALNSYTPIPIEPVEKFPQLNTINKKEDDYTLFCNLIGFRMELLDIMERFIFIRTFGIRYRPVDMFFQEKDEKDYPYTRQEFLADMAMNKFRNQQGNFGGLRHISARYFL